MTPDAEREAQTADTEVPASRCGGPAGTGDPPAAEVPAPARRKPRPWAQLLLRVFFIQALRCPKCSTAMLVLAFISDPPVITTILHHLRLPTEPPPLAPARGATTAQLWGLDPPCHAHPHDPAGDAPDPIRSPRPYPQRDPDPEDAPLIARPPP